MNTQTKTMLVFASGGIVLAGILFIVLNRSAAKNPAAYVRPTGSENPTSNPNVPATTQFTTLIHGKFVYNDEAQKGIKISLLPDRLPANIAIEIAGIEAKNFDNFVDNLEKAAKSEEKNAAEFAQSPDAQDLAEKRRKLVAKWRDWGAAARIEAQHMKAPITPDDEGLVRIQNLYDRLKVNVYFDPRFKPLIVATTTTDFQGEYIFSGVASGEYIIFAENKVPKSHEFWFLPVMAKGGKISLSLSEANSTKLKNPD